MEADDDGVFGAGVFLAEELPGAVVGVVGDVEDGGRLVDDGAEGEDGEVYGFVEGGGEVFGHGFDFKGGAQSETRDPRADGAGRSPKKTRN